MKISILLCTYNGENFLRQQLDSLYIQTFKNFSIYIHDDGSDDKTIDIIKDYQTKNKNIFLIESENKHLGAAKSFMFLLKNVDSDYYMFCDQDDVWLENKIQVTLDKMLETEKEYPDRPIVINTDLIVVDKNLNVIDESFWKYSKINIVLSFSSFDYMCAYSSLTGCTMMINKRVKDIVLPMHEDSVMHDIWIGLKVKAQNGILSYVLKPTILYRQHGNNVLGALETNSKHYLKRIIFFKKMVRDNYNDYQMIRAIKKYSIVRYIVYKILYLLKR